MSDDSPVQYSKYKPASVSIVVPTFGRPKLLERLFKTILAQTYLPLDVIVVDDSPSDDVKNLLFQYQSQFSSIDCALVFQRGTNRGLPAARNLGVSLCRGEAVLFLDDDVLLEHREVLLHLAFSINSSNIMGIQPKVINFKHGYGLAWKFNNSALKTLGLGYFGFKQSVRRSGESTFSLYALDFTVVSHLSGCCFMVKKKVFESLRFDENLKRWAYKEDLDFSYRVQKKWPRSLLLIPEVYVIHAESPESRLENKSRISMEMTYSFYVFFKDFFNSSFTNLLAFLYSVGGYFVLQTFLVATGRQGRSHPKNLIYPFQALISCLANLKNLRSGQLGFFNDRLN